MALSATSTSAPVSSSTSTSASSPLKSSKNPSSRSDTSSSSSGATAAQHAAPTPPSLASLAVRGQSQPQLQQQRRSKHTTTTTSTRIIPPPPRRVFSIFGFGTTTSGGSRMRFRFSRTRLFDLVMDVISYCVEGTVYLIGPVLIVLALGIVALLTYFFATVLVPMMLHKHSGHGSGAGSGGDNANTDPTFVGYVVVGLHCCWVVFLVVNILYNYAYCVVTKSGHSSLAYQKVVGELAAATNFRLPTSTADVANWRREYEDKMVLRVRRRRAREQEQQQLQLQRLSVSTGAAAADESATANVTHRRGAAAQPNNGNATTTANSNSQPPPAPAGASATSANSAGPQPQQLRRWMLMGPFEWGYCANSHQPKPPRSHYDHVSKQLVLNLDHYCPWMFNSIGYFNYRYFVNFLVYVMVGMLYGAIVSLQPFLLVGSVDYQKQWGEYQHLVKLHDKEYALAHQTRLRPMLPFRHERGLLTLSFMLCAAVGCAVLMLGGFHLYLACTAQTTIEFHANYANKRRAKAQGAKWQNPYSQGSWYRNLQQVYGHSFGGTGNSERRRWWHWLFAFLPSSRQPDALPVPTVPGHSGLRRQQHDDATKQEPGEDEREGDPLLLMEQQPDGGMGDDLA